MHEKKEEKARNTRIRGERRDNNRERTLERRKEERELYIVV